MTVSFRCDRRILRRFEVAYIMETRQAALM